jgi:hypothetical protein
MVQHLWKYVELRIGKEILEKLRWVCVSTLKRILRLVGRNGLELAT